MNSKINHSANNKLIIIDKGVEKEYKENIIPGLDITILGYNNTVKIELPNIFKNSKIIVENTHDSYVEIKANSTNMGCFVKDNFFLSVSCGSNQYFYCGENFSCGGVKFLIGGENIGIKVGNNCMFSDEIRVLPVDGHVIYDLEDSSKILNRPYKSIEIGDHVWVSNGVQILKNSKIPSNSIVGANSIVTKEFNESNIVLSGAPATIKKRNVNWEKDDLRSYDDKFRTIPIEIPKNSKDIAFLMPIYPPHFEHAKKFMDSYIKYGFNLQAHIWFVFTNRWEQDQFIEKYYEYKEYFSTIIVHQKYITEHMWETNGIINLKKLYGLSMIKKLYKYTIVIDNDTLLIKNSDLIKMCEEYFENKTLLGSTNLIWYNTEVKNVTRALFKEKQDVKIEKDELCLWFNQICIYKNDTLDDFFEKIDFENSIYNLTFAHFDYYIYMYYLLLFQGFHIEDTEVASQAFLTDGDLKNFKPKTKKYKSLRLYHCHRRFLHLYNKEKIFLLHQTDQFDTTLENKIKKISKKVRKIACWFVPSKRLRRIIKGQ